MRADAVAVPPASRQELEALQQGARDAAAAAEQHHADTLAAAKADAEESSRRHLGFIDRLMADKDDLGRQVASLNAAAQVRGRRAGGLWRRGSAMHRSTRACMAHLRRQ